MRRVQSILRQALQSVATAQAAVYPVPCSPGHRGTQSVATAQADAGRCTRAPCTPGPAAAGRHLEAELEAGEEWSGEEWRGGERRGEEWRGEEWSAEVVVARYLENASWAGKFNATVYSKGGDGVSNWAYIHACTHACVHACIRACIHAYMHTCVQEATASPAGLRPCVGGGRYQT